MTKTIIAELSSEVTKPEPIHSLLHTFRYRYVMIVMFSISPFPQPHSECNRKNEQQDKIFYNPPNPLSGRERCTLIGAISQTGDFLLGRRSGEQMSRLVRSGKGRTKT